MNGSHYNRSVKGFFLLAEALQRLLLEAFFDTNNANDYSDELNIIEKLQTDIAEKKFSEGKIALENFKSGSNIIVKDLIDFVRKRCDESRLFKYWCDVLVMIQILRDLITSDRSRDWILHRQTVIKLLPIIRLFV